MAPPAGAVATAFTNYVLGRSREPHTTAPAPVFSLAELDNELGRLCAPQTFGDITKPAQPVSDGVILRVQTILKHIYAEDVWWTRPRTYAILRTIGGLKFMQNFTKIDWSDFLLPVHEADLPGFVQDEEGNPFRERFLEIQNYYLSPTKDIESRKLVHLRIPDGDAIFNHIGTLGQGAFGSVDRVWSSLSLKHYARKRVLKGGDSEHSRQAQRGLIAELKALKRLDHHHLVQIMGSYTDTQYIAYLMSPIAECSLGEFLAGSAGMTDHKMSMLRRFYGCLAGAVNYLHQQQIRHNDLTRRNVLIFRGEVYISDFGSCHSWSMQSPMGSRTRHFNTPVSPDYMAPEVARPDSASGPKGRAVDMWALGVLFLEMTTRLLGRRLEDLQAAIRKGAAKYKPAFLHSNVHVVADWMETLRQGNRTSHNDNEPLQWIRVLLQKDPVRRLSSVQLMNRIQESPSFADFCCFKCHSQFADGGFAYVRQAPRFNAEDEAEAMMITVGGVFGKNYDGIYVPELSDKTTNFIEQWRRADAWTPAPEPHAEAEDQEESEPEVEFHDAPSIAADRLLYGIGGQTFVPQPPPQPPYADPSVGPTDNQYSMDIVSPRNTWDLTTDREDIELMPQLTGEDAEALNVRKAESPQGTDPNALFEEVESASSNEDREEDHSKMFDEVYEGSDSSSDVSAGPFHHQAHPELEYGRERDEVENTWERHKTVDIRPIDSGHEMFDEVEEGSASEDEAAAALHGLSPADSTTSDEESAQVELSDTPATESRNTGKNIIGENAPIEESERDLSGTHEETQKAIPSLSTAIFAGSGAANDEPKPAADNEHGAEVAVEPPTTPTVQPEISEAPAKKVTFADTDNIRDFATEDSNVPQEQLRPRGGVPGIKIHPPDDAASSKGKTPASTGRQKSNATDRTVRLTKQNLQKLAPKRPKERDPVELLNPATFLKSTWDDASSVATSAMSENTKKSLSLFGLPVKEADRMQDILTLHCNKGKASVVRYLLSKGCNPGTTEARRPAPIVRAVRGRSKRHIKCVGALIRHGVDLNVKTSKSKKTPLHYAIENEDFPGYEKLIWLLVDQSARTDRKDGDGETPLMRLFSGAGEKPLEKHRLQALAILLHVDADINGVFPGTGDSPLHMAVRTKDEWSTTMLLHKGANVTAKNASGTTPIQITANQFRGQLSKEHATVLNILLKYISEKRKSAIDERAGSLGRTALHHAVASGTAQAVELLLKYGASTSATDKAGHDSIHYAITRSAILASDPMRIEDHIEIMERLNKAAGCKWPVKQGVCSLSLACSAADGVLLRSFLDRGLVPDTLYKGIPLLHVAVKKRRIKAVEILVDAGAYIDRPDAKTAIAYAVDRGEDKMALLMARKGKFTKQENQVTVQQVEAMIEARKKAKVETAN